MTHPTIDLTRCESGHCVRVVYRPRDDRMLISDSKLTNSPVLEYTRDEWSQLLDVMRKVATPWLAAAALRGVEPLDSGGVCWLPPKLGRHMHFDEAEWATFVADCRVGRFDLKEPADA